jgi:protease PrsW
MSQTQWWAQGPTSQNSSAAATASPELVARRQYLESEIGRREAAVAEAQSDVGRAVVTQIRKSGAEPLSGAEIHLASIDRANDAICHLRRQIATVDAEAATAAAALAQTSDPTTHCPACHAARLADERFCAKCGESLPTAVTPASACDRCGRETRTDGAYCTVCGWRVAISSLPWWRARWLRIFIGGLVLYAFSQMILPHTNYNTGFIAAELVIGSMLVPLTFVCYFYERGTVRQTPLDVLAITFVLGAVLGCAAAAILEGAVTAHGNWQYVPVGFIEEACKGAILVWWLRRRDLLSPDKGFVIGAATGMGFAVLETMGTYALKDLISAFLNGAQGTTPISLMMSTLNLRGALAPLGHGTWTGILAGVMWYERSAGRSPFGKRVVGTYVAVSILHALYDVSISSHVMPISFVSGSQIPLPGLMFGLLGFVALMVMVRLVRRGQDPVAAIVDRVHQVQGMVQSRPQS